MSEEKSGTTEERENPECQAGEGTVECAASQRGKLIERETWPGRDNIHRRGCDFLFCDEWCDPVDGVD